MNTKKVLLVANCSNRANTTGLVGQLLEQMQDLRGNQIVLSLLDYNIVEKHNPKDYPVDVYYCIGYKGRIIKACPIIRRIVRFLLTIFKFYKLASSNNYDLIIFYQLLPETELLVRIAKRFNSKVLLFPWGSDMLRASGHHKKSLARAFSMVDFVTGAEGANTITSALNDYNVPINKIRYQKQYSKGIYALLDKDSSNRVENSHFVGLPVSNYNIVCGYRSAPDQRYELIIEKSASIKEYLPDDYQFIFLLTYGVENKYLKYKKLKALCDHHGLKACFLLDYLTENQIAALHRITDLLITILPTDTGNAFLAEALISKNTIITGKWLHYKHFEKFGVPYYLLESPDKLDEMMKKLFLKQLPKIEIPVELIKALTPSKDFKSSDYWANVISEL